MTHRGPDSIPGIARVPEPGVMSDHPEPDRINFRIALVPCTELLDLNRRLGKVH